MALNHRAGGVGLRLARATGLAATGLMMTMALVWAQEPKGVPAGAPPDLPAVGAPLSGGMPPTRIEPAPETTAGPSAEGMPPEAAPASAATGEVAKPTAHRAVSHQTVAKFETEPASGKVKITKETWIYASPSTHGKHLKRGEPDKFVVVTGSTRHYLVVALQNGKVGYIPQSAVELVRPTDKLFALTHDAAVREAPNKWAKKVAEVHQGHNVHVIGVALDYMKIRMHSGLEGYVPTSALE